MSLSRRQFFRRLVKPGEKSARERKARYDEMAAYVRTNLLPYDFCLTEAQEAELFAAVRASLEEAGDEELFSTIVRYRVDEVVDTKLRPWRDASQFVDQASLVEELRKSAVDYVSVFLHAQATPAAVEQLKRELGLYDISALEAELKKRVEAWILTVEDGELLRYDVVTVKDLVFAQLRSWC